MLIRTLSDNRVLHTDRVGDRLGQASEGGDEPVGTPRFCRTFNDASLISPNDLSGETAAESCFAFERSDRVGRWTQRVQFARANYFASGTNGFPAGIAGL